MPIIGLSLSPFFAYSAFIVKDARIIEMAYPSCHGIVIFAVAGLVAERPHDDARMVLVAEHHVDRSIEESRGVTRVAANAVIKIVRL